MSRIREVGVLVVCMVATLACKGREGAGAGASAKPSVGGSAARASPEGRVGSGASASAAGAAGQARPTAVPAAAVARGLAGQTAGVPMTPAAAPAAAAVPAGDAAEATEPASDEMEDVFPQRHTAGEDVTEKMQRRIRYQLRDVARAPIALRDLIQAPRPDGGVEVYAIYEYSVYEDCVKGAASRQEGRAKCLEEPVSVVIGDNPDHDEEDSNSYRYLYKQVRLGRECRKYGAVYATFSPAPAGKVLGEEGALRVLSLPLPEIDCELQTLAQFFVDDVDGDRQPELYLDVTSARPSVGKWRGSYADDIDIESVTRRRNVLILRATGEGLDLQGKIPDAEVHLRELNRDGHLDMVAVGRCLEDLAAGEIGVTEESCVQEMRERIWYLYDRELDSWVLHGEPPLKRPWEETP